MWKWIVGIALVGGLLLCVAGAVAGGWVLQSQRRQTEIALRAEEETELAAAKIAVENAKNNARATRLQAARAAYGAGEWEAAVTGFTEVLREDPDSLEATFGRGRSLARLTRLSAAAADLRVVTQKQPDHGEAWEALAWVYTKDGLDAEAVAALDRLLALDDPNARGFRDRADARYRTGDVAGALADAKQACALGLTEGCTLEERIRSVSGR